MKLLSIAIVSCVLVAISGAALAACPVGKSEGDIWCENHMEYRCDKCGSEYCQIFTGNSCFTNGTHGWRVSSLHHRLRLADRAYTPAGNYFGTK